MSTSARADTLAPLRASDVDVRSFRASATSLNPLTTVERTPQPRTAASRKPPPADLHAFRTCIVLAMPWAAYSVFSMLHTPTHCCLRYGLLVVF